MEVSALLRVLLEQERSVHQAFSPKAPRASAVGKDRCLRSESTAPLLSLPPYPPPEPAKITSAFGISQRPFCSEGYWLLVWIEDIGSAGPLPGDKTLELVTYDGFDVFRCLNQQPISNETIKEQIKGFFLS